MLHFVMYKYGMVSPYASSSTTVDGQLLSCWLLLQCGEDKLSGTAATLFWQTELKCYTV